jgi:hypothetical protein
MYVLASHSVRTIVMCAEMKRIICSVYCVTLMCLFVMNDDIVLSRHALWAA